MNWTGGKLKQVGHKTTHPPSQKFGRAKQVPAATRNKPTRTATEDSSVLEQKHKTRRQTKLNEYETLAPLVAKLDSLVPDQHLKRPRHANDKRSHAGSQIRNIINHSISVLNQAPPASKSKERVAYPTEDVHKGVEKYKYVHHEQDLEKQQPRDINATQRSRKRSRGASGNQESSLDIKIKTLLEKPDWVGIALAKELAQPLRSKVKTFRNYTTAVVNRPSRHQRRRRERSPLLKQVPDNLGLFDDESLSIENGEGVPHSQIFVENSGGFIEEPLHRSSSTKGSEGNKNSPRLQHASNVQDHNESRTTTNCDLDLPPEGTTEESTSQILYSIPDPQPSPRDEDIQEEDGGAIKDEADDSASELWKAFVFGRRTPERGSPGGQPRNEWKILGAFTGANENLALQKSGEIPTQRLRKGNIPGSPKSDFSFDRPSSVANASVAPTVLFTGKQLASHFANYDG